MPDKVTTESNPGEYYQYRLYGDNHMEPVGPLGLITHQLSPALSDSLNENLRERRSQYVVNHPYLVDNPGFMRYDYRIGVDLTRFTSGEGRAAINQTVRGHDLFIVTDVLNYGIYYTRFGQTVTMSPDEHFQDLVRLIMVASASARRVNVIMPYLYEGRRYRRQGRESLDCALMLKQLFGLGIANFLTFDPHDSRVANAVPASNFESLTTSFQFIEALLENMDDLILDADHFMVVSPDETTISRCIYYASLMKVPMGIFYRRRNFGRIDHLGKTEVTKEFLGDDITGKDILLVDDMIDTGATMIECATFLKERGARRVFCVASFAQFTAGLDNMQRACDAGIINQVYASNLSYHEPALLAKPWYINVDFSRYLALLIDAINHDASISRLISPTTRISRLLAEHQPSASAADAST